MWGVYVLVKKCWRFVIITQRNISFYKAVVCWHQNYLQGL